MNQSFKRFLKISGVVLGSAAAGLGICAALKKRDSQYFNEPEQRNPFEGKRVAFIADENDKENADGARGHLVAVGDATPDNGLYEKYQI